MKRLLIVAIVLAALGWWLTGPNGLPASVVPEHVPDLVNGERLFHAGGCASCHGRVEDGKPRRDVMAGGLVMRSPVGAFHVPNISSDTVHGIGAWSELDFLNAMQRGLAPDGSHYYPAFPYTSYARMNVPDLLDLKAYLDQLPASPNTVPEHELDFPFGLRRGLGLWKRLFLDESPVVIVPADDELLRRGRYLVEGAGHCGECHTPRNAAQAMDPDRWLIGGANPEGEGRVPGLTPARESFADWTAEDIAYYLEAGVDPDFDVVGGTMAAVQDNMSRLPAEDREAIAAYLKALQP
jgi:mono/diheme cytochrome c family protein